MSSQQLHLEPIDLGLGWTATEVWFEAGPIVLVQARSEGGQILKSRFDTQKSMFIDPLPIKPDETRIHELVDAVAAACSDSKC